jgi:hypothetical protein
LITCFFDSCADNNNSKILLFLSVCYMSKLSQDKNQSWAGGNLAACELRMRSCVRLAEMTCSTPLHTLFLLLPQAFFFPSVCYLYSWPFALSHLITLPLQPCSGLFFFFFFLIFRTSCCFLNSNPWWINSIFSQVRWWVWNANLWLIVIFELKK